MAEQDNPGRVSFGAIARSLSIGLRDFRMRTAFATRPDWFRWTLLRFLNSRYGRAFGRYQTSVPVRFRGHRSPMHLRPGSSDFKVAEEIFLESEYGMLQALDLPDAPTIVDLGSNIGCFLSFADERWRDARFIAVEPEKENLRLLRENTELLLKENKLKIVEGCVGGKKGKTTLDLSGGAWSVQMTGRSGSDEVEIFTMPELFETSGLSSIQLLKCDIEGAERDVFRDCASWINKVHALVIELHAPYALADLEADLNRNGSTLKRHPAGRAHKATYLFVS